MAGTVGSGIADLFVEVGSGGTATLAMPTIIAAEMTLITTVTAAIGAHASMVMKNSLNGNNYSSSTKPPWETDDRVPLDRETILNDKSFKKTSKKYKGATIYEKDGKRYYRDTFHRGKASHLEVFDKSGKHLGEADPVTGTLKPNTADPNKKLPK